MTKPTTLPAGYDAEMRFGVVMYGGVSLAIYIYGVSYEIFELACATPMEGRTLPGDSHPDGGTREVYRRLSLLASDPEFRARYAALLAARQDPGADVWPDVAAGIDAGADATRFVVDVIAGTSAGGINGIFLAKALAQSQSFAALGDMWIDEGDIGALLNDGEAWKGLPAGLARPKGPPASLLSSDRMYLKLLKAFGEMAPLAGSGAGAGVGAGTTAAAAQTTSPLVEELDLYVTTTDIAGAPVPLRLFDKVVYERRHKQRFHFSYPTQMVGAEAGFDFGQANHPFLAFAARCTSSFPFAFEPMTVQRMRDLSPSVSDAQVLRWQAYFDGIDGVDGLSATGLAGRPFGDGGYLDNKPFSYVADTLSRRFGDAPAQRKLIYVEPNPEPLQPDEGAHPVAPNAVQNALTALLGIPQYETIREDLNTVLKRNRRIDRVERIVRLAEQDVERLGGSYARVVLRDGQLPPWKDLSLDDMLAYYGPGFAPYRRLRVYAVSDWLTEQVAAAFGVDGESDRGYALRAVVRAWRESRFTDNPQYDDPKRLPLRRSVNTFLQEHDLDYRLRRLTFLLRRVDLMTRLVRRPQAARADVETLVAEKMARVYGGLNPLDPLAKPDLQPLVLKQLRDLKQKLRDVYRRTAAIRRAWANGVGILAVVQPDATLRQELDDVLAMLLGQPPSAGRAAPQVRNVDGKRVAIPQDLVWLQSGSTGYSLQDSVMRRVQDWLQRSVGQPKLVLWEQLLAAFEATRLDEKGPQGAAVDRLLNEAWNLIGQPCLRVHVVQKLVPVGISLPTREAELVVSCDSQVPPGTEADALHCLRMLLGEYFLNFDAFDQTRYTLYYDTGTGEPATVDVVRVSPVDATALRAFSADHSKLAGTGLAHFGAFLDEHWRRNDIMWGRLDGAERLVQTVLPADDAATRTVRTELIRLAHGRILTQTLKSRSSGALTGWLATALNQVSGVSADDKLQRLLNELKINPGPARERLAAALHGLMGPDELRHYASTQATFDPRPPMDRTLRNAARAVTVTGRVLEGVSLSDAPSTAPLGRWAARLGLLLQGAMAVAVPGTLRQRLFGHLLPMVYGFELLLLVLALLFGDAGLRFTALSALGVTGLLHLLTLLLRDVARNGHGGRVIFGVVVAAALLLPAGFGLLAYTQQRGAAVCGATVDAAKLTGWVGTVCGWWR